MGVVSRYNEHEINFGRTLYSRPLVVVVLSVVLSSSSNDVADVTKGDVSAMLHTLLRLTYLKLRWTYGDLFPPLS